MGKLEINYVVGRYWDRKKSDSICSYTDWNCVVHRGTEEDAFKHAQHLSEKEGTQYRVFQLMDLGTYYDPDPC